MSRRRLLAAALGMLAILATALLSARVVMIHVGWPFNHDWLAWKFMTQVYAWHDAQGDWLPVWSADDAYGFGTPRPLFYHKLFYYVSGLVHFGGASIKHAVLTALVFFLCVGGVGVYRCGRRLGLGHGAAVCFGAMVPLLNYTVTDWLIRGSFAELSACMMVPWFLLVLIRFLQSRVLPLTLAPALLAVGLGHAVLGYWGAVLAGLAFAIVGAKGWRKGWKAGREELARNVGRGVGAVVVFGVMAAPYLWAYGAMREGFDPSSVTAGGVSAKFELSAIFARYLWDTGWVWGRTWEGLPLELDWGVLGAVVGAWGVAAFGRRGGWVRGAAEAAGARNVGGAAEAAGARNVGGAAEAAGARNVGGAAEAAGVRRARGAAETAAAGGEAPAGEVVLFFVLSLVILFALQLPASNVIYETLPGAAMIQFPWRLLGFIQILLLLLAAAGLARLKPKLATAGAAALLVVSVASLKSLTRLHYPWFPPSEVEDPGVRGIDAGVLGIGEYLPVVIRPGEVLDPKAKPFDRIGPLIRAWSAQPAQLLPAAPGCSVALVDQPAHEELEVRYGVSCLAAATLVLPLDYAGLTRAWVVGGNRGQTTRTALKTFRTAEDARLHIDLPPGGGQVVVALPRLGNLPPFAP